jgi:23S rRNA G2445 N2-methylase RlmL
MDFYNQQQKIFVSCNRRINVFLAKETEALGYKDIQIANTGVALQGTMHDCIRLNLNLRCASQVLIELSNFVCDSPDDLYKGAAKIDWTTLIKPSTYFSITSNVFHPSINNNLFANVVVKDAIVDCFNNKLDTRPDSGPLKEEAVFHLHWADDNAILYLDTSGETLAKHGYRKIPGRAPMLESLAAATLLATEWDAQSTFINPMCGSGTVAIEAALIATNRRPGLLRDNYSFMHFINYQKDVYEMEMQKLKDLIVPELNFKIVATDLSRKAVEIAQTNAEYAEVDQYIHFEVGDFTKTPISLQKKGIVFMNPEYGERLGEIEELEETYATIGDFLKQCCKGYTAYIFTGNLDLAKRVGLKASRRFEFYNGKIDCRLLKYELYEGSRRSFPEQENKNNEIKDKNNDTNN